MILGWIRDDFRINQWWNYRKTTSWTNTNSPRKTNWRSHLRWVLGRRSPPGYFRGGSGGAEPPRYCIGAKCIVSEPNVMLRWHGEDHKPPHWMNFKKSGTGMQLWNLLRLVQGSEIEKGGGTNKWTWIDVGLLTERDIPNIKHTCSLWPNNRDPPPQTPPWNIWGAPPPPDPPYMASPDRLP